MSVHSCVSTVVKDLNCSVITPDTNVYTQVNDHTSVRCVVKHLVCSVISPDTGEYTRVRNRTLVLTVGKDSPKKLILGHTSLPVQSGNVMNEL